MLANTLRVVSIFQSIQSEGPLAGRSAVFVRLADCNLSCSFCDEDYSNVKTMTHQEVVDAVIRAADQDFAQTHLVVITGGEPFLQDFSPVANELYRSFHLVQVETNGTLAPKSTLNERVMVVVSPKEGTKIHTSFFCMGVYWKYVVKAGDIINPLTADIGRIYIQPMDEGDIEKNKANNAWAVKMCIANNWRLSTQVHKFLGFA